MKKEIKVTQNTMPTEIQDVVFKILGDKKEFNVTCAEIFCEAQILAAAALEASDVTTDEVFRAQKLCNQVEETRSELSSHGIVLKSMMLQAEENSELEYTPNTVGASNAKAELYKETLPKTTAMLKEAVSMFKKCASFMVSSNCSFIHDLGMVYEQLAYFAFTIGVKALQAEMAGKCPEEEASGLSIAAALSIGNAYSRMKELDDIVHNNGISAVHCSDC